MLLAIYDGIRILNRRGYLHGLQEVEFIRPGYESVFPCGKDGSEGPIDLNQLKWAADKGDFWFDWYPGSFLRIEVRKEKMRRELKLDPTKKKVREFVRKVDSAFK